MSMLIAQLAGFRKISAQYAPSCTVCPTTAPSCISREALSTPNTSNRSGMQIQPQHCWNIRGTSMTGQRKPQTESTGWTAHGQAIHRNFDQKTHNTKLVHNILPTNHRVHRYDKTRSAKCPLCKHPDEDRDHIVRCPHATHRRWRADLLNALHMKCVNLRMRPILTVILLDGISEWLKGRTLSQYRYELRYHQLIQEQNDIGWRHIFNGRLSLQWSELQGDYLFEINNSTIKRSVFQARYGRVLSFRKCGITGK